MAGEKTEKATPKKRQDERKKGNVFQGKDINIAFNLLVMFVALRLLGEYIYRYMGQTMVYFISQSSSIKALSVENLTKLLINIAFRMMALILPLLLISAFTSFILSGMQTRFMFTTKNIKFKLSRLDPIAGIKKHVSMRSTMQLVKSIIMITIVSIVIYVNILEFAKSIPSFYYMPVQQTVFYVANKFFDIFIKVCITVIAIGVLDFIFQWRQHEKEMRMTKQEVKDEYKMTEGDPLVKSAIRSRQQKMAQKRMMQKVPEADVVIVNPEHFAVALKYDDTKSNAPVVVAKGIDHIALKIKAIAAEHDIRIEENPPLARALYKAVEIDREIPPEFYKAVAEILTYVYNLRKKSYSRSI